MNKDVRDGKCENVPSSVYTCSGPPKGVLLGKINRMCFLPDKSQLTRAAAAAAATSIIYHLILRVRSTRPRTAAAGQVLLDSAESVCGTRPGNARECLFCGGGSEKNDIRASRTRKKALPWPRVHTHGVLSVLYIIFTPPAGPRAHACPAAPDRYGVKIKTPYSNGI